MKKLLPLFIVFLYASSVFAQSGGPDGFGYIWRDSSHPQGPVYNWIDITGLPDAQQITELTDDNTTASFRPMGFQFPYYWYAVSSYKVGANGFIIFSNGNIASPFPAIPSSAAPQDYIAGMMSDLSFEGAGNPAQCWTWTNSVDSLIVTYIDVPFWENNTSLPYTGSNTFQIILSAVDSSITFQYMTQVGVSAATANIMTIGIENNTGAIGLQHSQNTYPTPLTAVKFYYPASTTLSIIDASAYYNENDESGGIFLSQDGNPYYMKARIKNTGNDTIPPFNSNLRILSNIGATLVQENIMSDTLLPGQTQDLISTLPFNPLTAGNYTFRTQTQLTGDVTTSNNDRYSEIIVVDTTQVNIPLSYAGAAPVPIGSGISWSGGNSGMGVEIVPPFYPCYIRKIDYYIVDNTDVTGFWSYLYDNQGINAGPGNMLDSNFVPGIQVIAPDFWNTVTLATPIRVDSGSVFVEWLMEGANISLGTDETVPIGNRSYEILGGAWSIYRSRETEDPMIRLQVATSATAGISQNVYSDFVGEFYPTPSQSRMYMDLALNNNKKDVQFKMFNLQGQMVQSTSKSVNGTQRVMFDVSSLSPGVYVCNIVAGDNQYNRKFIVQ